jgi:hypothetical protein
MQFLIGDVEHCSQALNSCDRNEPALEHEHAVPHQGRGTGHPLPHRLRQGLLRARRYDVARKTGFLAVRRETSVASWPKFRPPK